MIYTIKKLFELIDEKKTPSEFFYGLTNGGEGVDYYISLVTNFTPEEKIIIKANCHCKPIILQEMPEQEVLVDDDEILLFEFMAHDEDFKISRMEGMDEVKEKIFGDLGIFDMFTRDMIVIQKGFRKKYIIKDINDCIVKWDDFNKNNKTISKNFYKIEWI